MTDKQDFLDKLRAALLERDISETDIRPYIDRFDRFFDRMVNDPDNNRADILSDVNTIADNIASQVSERYDEINRLAERTMTVERVEIDVEAPKPAPADDVPVKTDQQPAPVDNIPAKTNRQSTAAPIQPDPVKPSHEETVKKLPDYIDEEPAPNSTIFWVLFGVSLPVTIPLALCAIALFIAVWGGLAALIAGSIAALIVTAAGGTALSLIGIIYGITKLFSVMPVGLYEIGLGVLVGGCVMFTGILLYNFAVRLLPRVIKLVAQFFRYLYGQFIVLFVFLRKECAKL